MIISKAFRRCRMINNGPNANTYNVTMSPIPATSMPRSDEYYVGVFALRGGRMTEDDWAKWFASATNITQLTYNSLTTWIAANRPDLTVALNLTGGTGTVRTIFNDNKRVFDFSTWTPNTAVFSDASPLKFDSIFFPMFIATPNSAIQMFNILELTPADIKASGQALAMDGTQGIWNSILNIGRIELAMY